MKQRRGLGGTTTKLAFEVWKYYGGIGGDDKDKMIQIVTWLLGFSSLIIGFLCQRQANGTSGERFLLAVLGMLISFSGSLHSASVPGGYATWELGPSRIKSPRTMGGENRNQTTTPLRRSKPTGRPRFPCATPNRVRINLPMFFGSSLLFPFCLLLFISGFWSTRFDQPGALPAAPKQTLLLTRRPRGHAWERSKDVGY